MNQKAKEAILDILYAANDWKMTCKDALAAICSIVDKERNEMCLECHARMNSAATEAGKED